MDSEVGEAAAPEPSLASIFGLAATAKTTSLVACFTIRAPDMLLLQHATPLKLEPDADLDLDQL